MDKDKAKERLMLLAVYPPKLVPVSGTASPEERSWIVSIFHQAAGYVFASDWLPFEKAIVRYQEVLNEHVQSLNDLAKKAEICPST